MVLSGSGTNVTVTGLTPGATYGVAAFAYAGSGALIQYRTSDAPSALQRANWLAPALGAASAVFAGITTNSAVLTASVTDSGGTNLVRWGTVWGTSAAPAGNVYTNLGSTNAPFTISDARSGEFAPGQHYYFRGWADNGDYVSYSSDGDFYTEPSPAANVQFSSVQGTQFTLSWATNATQGGVLILLKVGSAVDADPVDGVGTYSAASAYGVGTQVGTGNYVVYYGSGTNVTVTGLSVGQTVYVKVCGYAGAGTSINYGQNSGVTASAQLAGGGTWNSVTASGNWSDNSNWTNGVIASGSNNAASFSTVNPVADVTVHVNSALTIGSLAFGDTDTNTAAGWTLDNNGVAGNVLTLAASSSPMITVNALGVGKAATISATVAGTGGLVKSGDGLLVLSATNAYSGTTLVSGGVLRADHGVGLPAAGNLTLSRGVLEISQDLMAVYGSGAGQVQMTESNSGFSAYGSVPVTVSLGTAAIAIPPNGAVGSTLILNAPSANQPLTFDKPLTTSARAYIEVASPTFPARLSQKLSSGGSSTFVGKIGVGTLILAGGWDVTNTCTPRIYAGTLIVSNCAVNVTNTQDIVVGYYDLAYGTLGGTLTVQTGATVTAKTLDLAAYGAASGTVNLDGGIVTVNRVYKGSGSGSTTLYLNGGTLKALDASQAGTFLSNLSNVFVKAGGAVLDDGGFAGITIGNALKTDAVSLGGGLAKQGAGSVILNGTNTYTGGTTIQAGTLVANANGALGTGSVVICAGAVLQLNNAGVSDNLIADTATVRLNASGSTCGQLSLQNGVTDTIHRLYLGGVLQPIGTYGSTNAGTVAMYKLDNWFDGSVCGVLNVLDGPCGTIFKFY